LVRDSKQLTPGGREILFHHIRKIAVAVGIGIADCEVVDARGIVVATRLSMKMAVQQLSPAPEFLLIDYLHLPEINLPQKGITFGDSLCFSIACASIIAKVTRDRLMVELDEVHQGYGMARHKGYGTRQHLDCLLRLGPSPAHRRSFKPVREMIET
jgi:ribonuclease HII